MLRLILHKQFIELDMRDHSRLYGSILHKQFIEIRPFTTSLRYENERYN